LLEKKNDFVRIMGVFDYSISLEKMADLA
jgi:hypothetical protein